MKASRLSKVVGDAHRGLGDRAPGTWPGELLDGSASSGSDAAAVTGASGT